MTLIAFERVLNKLIKVKEEILQKYEEIIGLKRWKKK